MRSLGKRFFLSALAVALLLTPVSSAKALRVAIQILSTPQKTMKSDVIVVGKVAEIEKDLVQAVPYPKAPTKSEYQVAVIKISDALQGAKGLSQIRVGWVVRTPNVVNPSTDAPRLKIRPPFVQMEVTLQADQEGVFFLKKHPEADFYVMVPNSQPLDKKAENFDKELGNVKNIIKVVAKPLDALKAEKSADRQLAAAVLLSKYGTYPEITDPTAQPKQEPINDEESKLILKALTEMEWANGGEDQFTSLGAVFYMLGLNEKDGWKQPAFNGQGDFNKLMKDSFDKWAKENGDKFRVKQWVVGKK